MTLSALGSCEGAADSDSGSSVHLLRVVLQNFLIALQQSHIERSSAILVFQDLLNAPLFIARPIADIHVDQLYIELVAILARRGPDLYFERARDVTSFHDERALTYQPSWAFEYWLDTPEARRRVHSAADVITLIADFETAAPRIAGAKVGADREVVWLTPKRGLVKAEIDEAWQDQATGLIGAIDTKRVADNLRALLGLHRRLSPERAVALVLGRTVGELRRDAESRAAVGKGRRPLAAPTQLDARGYPRFRHWPEQPDDADPDFGRTWKLPPGSSRHDGAPEVVVEPFDLALVRQIVTLGPIRASRLTFREAFEEDRAFADSLCGAQTVPDLLDRLGRTLGL